MKPLHGFAQDEKWYEDLAHVLLGVLPIGLLLWAREWTDWRMPWPFRGQWPPGVPIHRIVPRYSDRFFAPLSRVADSARDELGYRIGATVRNVGLIVWFAIREAT